MKVMMKQKSDIVPYNDVTVGYCQCTECPTHEQCKADEQVFCSVGESDNSRSITQNGCICSTCQNFKHFKLKNGYFCINGEAK